MQCWGTVVNSWRAWLRLASQGGLGVLDKSGNDLRSLWANLARGRDERDGKIGRFAPDDFAIDFDAIELDDQQERVGRTWSSPCAAARPRRRCRERSKHGRTAIVIGDDGAFQYASPRSAAFLFWSIAHGPTQRSDSKHRRQNHLYHGRMFLLRQPDRTLTRPRWGASPWCWGRQHSFRQPRVRRRVRQSGADLVVAMGVSPRQLSIDKNVALMPRSSSRRYHTRAHGVGAFRLRPAEPSR